jgi:hypothetical protein
VVLCGSGFESPVVARSIVVKLTGRTNTVKFFNVTGSAPDLDRITLSQLPDDDD